MSVWFSEWPKEAQDAHFEKEKLKQELAELQEKYNDVLESLEDMVNQHCTFEGQLDSGALSANRGALQALERAEKVKQIGFSGEYIWLNR